MDSVLVKSNGFNQLEHNVALVHRMHFPHCRVFKAETERHLTTLFSTVESAERPLIEAAAAKKNGWLPILTVLFLISYGLMTMLIVEQGQTIESQRALIRELFRDSTELSAVKLKSHAQQAQKADGPSAQAREKQAPSAPSTQAQAQQAPSSQVGGQARREAARQKQFRMPSKPSSDIAEPGRSLLTI